VRHAMEQERMKSCVGKNNLDLARGCGVHRKRSAKILPYFTKGLDHIFIFRLEILDCRLKIKN
jgi:hypothetical protein